MFDDQTTMFDGHLFFHGKSIICHGETVNPDV